MKQSQNPALPFSALGIPQESAAAKLRGCRAAVGFDGFLDTITRAVRKTGTPTAQPEYFDSISDFGTYLANHAQMNCSVELDVISERFGGNAPLLSNALGGLGVQVDCIGTFGDHRIHEAFENLHCRLHSFGPVSKSLALEFQDGKIFLGQNTEIPEPAWSVLCKEIGKPVLIDILRASDLLALVNWSELPFAQNLWEETFRRCFAQLDTDKGRFVLFDLCDIARKSDQQVLNILQLLGQYALKRYAVLSLNRNEALRLGACLGLSNDLQEISEALLHRYGLDEVVVHTREEALLNLHCGGTYHCQIVKSENPVVLTGAGDHFNAAYCAGLLLDLLPQKKIEFASSFASTYIRTAKTPAF